MERCINVCEEMYWRQIEKIFSLGARKQGALHFETLRDAYQNNRPGPFPPTVFFNLFVPFSLRDLLLRNVVFTADVFPEVYGLVDSVM